MDDHGQRLLVGEAVDAIEARVADGELLPVRMAASPIARRSASS
jgi:hypothetical protein